MAKVSKLALLHDMLENAESSIRGAKQLIADLGGEKIDLDAKYKKSAEKLSTTASPEGQIVEGIFDGHDMIGPDKKSYPVPANYASKSKLVAGDVLKLTIQDNGSFIYKQIGPVERKQVVGTLTSEDGQFKVMADGRAYKTCKGRGWRPCRHRTTDPCHLPFGNSHRQGTDTGRRRRIMVL